MRTQLYLTYGYAFPDPDIRNNIIISLKKTSEVFGTRVTVEIFII